MISASPWRHVTLAVILLATFAGVSQAQAPATEPAAPAAPGTVTNFLYADASKEGVIDLFFDAPGSRVVYFEKVGANLKRLGATQSAPGAQTIFHEATSWSCVRLVRSFHAAATLPDGTPAIGDYSLRTPSCADRFDVTVPRRVAPGKVGRVRVVDRWGIGGLRPVLCITPPRARRSCDTLAFPRAVSVATRRFRAAERGRWRVELRVRRHSERASVRVGDGPAAKPPRSVLATGDSTIQGVDSFLSAELGDGSRVRSDVRPGFGISKTSSYARFARDQVKKRRPAVTVVSIGGAEGAIMATPGGQQAECCGESWVAEYSRRVRAMMQTYVRRGSGRVYWLTQPDPREAHFALVVDAVNAAILRAGKDLRGVRVVDLDALFTPRGYADSIRYRGRSVHVRQADGVHLNVAGTAIVAKVVAEAIGADDGP